MTTRVMATVWLALVVLLFVVVGCQWGIGARAAPTPRPPATPMPALPSTEARDHNEKVIDGYLRVQYIPCEPTGAAYVAPIILTDLRSGSFILLNRNGTVKTSSKPRYTSDAGKTALEAVLKDASLVEQIVARPMCPDTLYKPNVRQRDGWPNAYAEDIGDPPMPKVAMVASQSYFKTPPQFAYPGWRGAYCWPVGGSSRECDDNADWKGFSGAEAFGATSGTRFHVAVLGDDANPGRVTRVEVFPVRTQWSLRNLGRELHLGERAYRFVATKGQTLEKFVMPKLPRGVYILVADYESPLGEVEYGFKVEVGK